MLEEPDLARDLAAFPSAALTVTELNRNVRDLLEHRYPMLWVRGEISNFVRARSGHAYFSLKDENAQVRCVMFRHRNQHLNWVPRDGIMVEVQALVSLYEPRGDFQLGVEAMRQAGLGALFEAFVRLRDRLQLEGLFDQQKKRPLPVFPRRIGVVTSVDAAALRDVLTTLQRRNPAIGVVIYPTPVQGDGAAVNIAAAIERASARGECDVLILTRGGGSLEDLWAFNDEPLARVIRSCLIPVITGIGHETDFTIADFAADCRAPTPTGAAELASPSRAALRARIKTGLDRLRWRMERDFESRIQRLDQLLRRLVHPGRRLAERNEILVQLRTRLSRGMQRRTDEASWKLQSLIRRTRGRLRQVAEMRRLLDASVERLVAGRRVLLGRAQARVDALHANLEHLGPQRVLERGYSIAQDAAGAVIRDSRLLSLGQELAITFARGSAKTRVESRD
ncbi:MAG: exodeoxyribonuclease VII large subunit [Betaproteobacteria bacterium RIFCSPLOWO2_12_FULL_63_13]|nr:MAG: exodeoxyribonuclease VII large subunit [Betaproteobacteria bacterium RIFCSPLOWO2_12_FULL_63_13]